MLKKIFLTFITLGNLSAFACVGDPCFQISEKVNKLGRELSQGLNLYVKNELSGLKVSDEEALERAIRLNQIYHMNRTNEDIVNDLLCNVPYQHPKKVARHKVDKKVYIRAQQETQECNFSKLLSSGIQSEEEFVKAIRQMNFNPCCIPKMSLNSISSTDKNIRGFSVGYEAGGGAGPFGVDLGREVVFIQTSENEMDIAVIEYKGIETSVGLPYGISTTQSILTGNCEKIDDYLGVFSGFDFGGIQFNTGLDKSSFNPTKKATGCNSEAIISGATTDLVGVNENRYSLASSVVRVKGPGIKKMLEFFKRTNTRAINRRKGLDAHMGSIEYLVKDFKRRISGGDNFFNDPALSSCSYSLDHQLKDFASIDH
ncbi:hypothetical protein [Bacteriovorax sp. DB6_IX]|uniref:hypothetical protein n=1 Tax=Bacteriovorax sp. DB6_IX TaxID=1353530 RepID=UPI00038A4389|nr:hypothetical protein [Bacteriovorax sp. DB6_IX]EQC50843.1 putative lipoprotein [Bacteriovorax sp. DB6_IX]